MVFRSTGYLSYFGRNMEPKVNKSQEWDNPRSCRAKLILQTPHNLFLVLLQVPLPCQLQRGFLLTLCGCTTAIPGSSSST